MSKKIIVLVIPDLKGNGAERVVLTLASGFYNKNCDVHIIVFNNFIELKINADIKIHKFKKHYRWLPRKIRGIILAPILDKFIIKHCGIPDLVLSNLLPADRILSYSKLNVHLVIHSTMSLELKYYQRNINELNLIYSKKPTVCVSKGVMNDFKKLFATHLSKSSCYIYNPVDVEQIKRYAQLNSKINTDYIIHIGKFNVAKRHDILIKAYHKSGVKNPLILVGQGVLQKQAKQLVQSLNLTKNVIFADFHTNPYPLIKNAKLMVLSSDFEGLGMVILEALVLGIPVISTDCPSGPSEILPSKNLSPVGDIDKLANKISDVAKSPLEYTVDLKENFLVENQINKYLNLIENK